jgi:hypothetical protein
MWPFSNKKKESKPTVSVAQAQVSPVFDYQKLIYESR